MFREILYCVKEIYLISGSPFLEHFYQLEEMVS